MELLERGGLAECRGYTWAHLMGWDRPEGCTVIREQRTLYGSDSNDIPSRAHTLAVTQSWASQTKHKIEANAPRAIMGLPA